MFASKASANERKDHMHPHLARKAIVRDVQTTRYGREYAGRRGKITHVDKDPRTGAATGYILRMEEGGNEVRFESEEIHITEASYPLFTQLRRESSA
jgi:hypothetical protein